MAEFADRVTLQVQAGHGGNGCASIHREKFKPLGGPDGGNGGRGGDVILEVDASSATLLDFHRRPVRRAGNGRQGEGSNRTGADAADLIIPVPNGTEVKTADGEVLADLIGVGTRFVAAAGGRGGLGNAALASPRRKAPGFALKGEPGEHRDLILELKTVADVGLVGFPNAGKSSLISAMSAARPKIADYPFTTLIPNLGVVEAGDVQFVVADVPGLIPGASRGKGLGHDFLRHVERCSTLVHVLDCATEEPGRDPITDLDVIEEELAAYGDATGAALLTRPRLVALNKIDVPAAREMADLVKPELEKRGYQVFEISAATGEGLRRAGLRDGRAGRGGPGRPPGRAARRAEAGQGQGAGRRRARLRGGQARRQLLHHGREAAALGPADRLQQRRGRRLPGGPAGPPGRRGALAEAGAEPGAEVLIGDPDDAVVFDWDPAAPMASGASGARGSGRPVPAGIGRAAPTPGCPRDRPGYRDRRARRHRHRDAGRGQGRLLVADHAGRRDRRRQDRRARRRAGRPPEDGGQVVLVSSGAIASGLAPLGLSARPRDLATQQAAASVGQGLLIARYTAAFARHGIRTGQVLLSADDLMRRTHYRNAQLTLDRLLELGVLPVVNENDTVATDEIRFGDNDRLAALVAHVTRAGALILLSDVDGL